MAFDSLEAVEPSLDRIDIGASMQQDSEMAQFGNVVNDAADHALTTVLSRPHDVGRTPGTAEGYLNADLGEGYLSQVDTSEPTGSGVVDMYEMLAELYTDVAAYKVAWNIAKRSGKDVETLLKGQ